jgi:hypothetical protein
MSLPPSTVLEDRLRSGVILAKLGNHYAPDALPLDSIFDLNEQSYFESGLHHVKHPANVFRWIGTLEALELPKV